MSYEMTQLLGTPQTALNDVIITYMYYVTCVCVVLFHWTTIHRCVEYIVDSVFFPNGAIVIVLIFSLNEYEWYFCMEYIWWVKLWVNQWFWAMGEVHYLIRSLVKSCISDFILRFSFPWWIHDNPILERKQQHINRIPPFSDLILNNGK